ncbi:UNVERIFIED_CONTAM: hypothetical protein PYX00_001421 [Menopon gallinae]|uniref:Uncharacterized protein n=1 Tax=Menopon gallinae TaxID=328185 RepID=A0AAW2ICP2_9NEOP
MILGTDLVINTIGLASSAVDLRLVLGRFGLNSAKYLLRNACQNSTHAGRLGHCPHSTELRWTIAFLELS